MAVVQQLYSTHGFGMFWMVLDGSENLLHRPFFSPQVRGKVSLEKVPGQFPSSNTWGDSVHVTIVEKHQAGSS